MNLTVPMQMKPYGIDERWLKTAAVDMDGPLYEFDKTMRYLLREERGCEGLEHPSPEWLLPGQPWHTVTQADWDWLWSEGQRLGLFRHGHVTKHAIRAVRAMQKAGWNIVALTHRPDNAWTDTRAWLDFHFYDEETLPFELVITQESKALYENAYVLIDDKPENVDAWRETGRPALLFARPWNRERRNASGYMMGWKHVLHQLRIDGLGVQRDT